MRKKRKKPAPKTPPSALDEAIEVKRYVKSRLDTCQSDEMPKLVDSYARAANVVRQFEKDRKRALAEFTDDELVEYMRALTERRRDAILIAVQGASLAGKPLF